jgi:uncharacterized protein YndB with AHSA1/START domain
MATVDAFIAAPPPDVYAVLADGWLYSNWVVGTSHMRAVGQEWPAAGSKLHHASGIWPLAFRDESEVVATEPDRSLTLTVKGRPFGEARVEMELTAEGAGTRVTMLEEPIRGPGKWLHNPVSDALLLRRNVESLARLAAIAERRTKPAEG